MHDYKKVLQLNHEGKSQRMIASLMKISRHTISDILKTSELLGITYETSTKMSNEEIYNFLYPDQVNDFTAYLPPDYKNSWRIIEARGYFKSFMAWISGRS